jgi:thymidine kinase
MDIATRIKSIRETIGYEYTRPDPNRLIALIDSLWASQKAIQYLRDDRGLTDETIKHFKLGYDQGQNAISIPVFKGGELVNFKYRLLDNPHQRYSGEANAEPWVYNEQGFEAAQKKGAVLLVEGEFDCMMAYQAGITNVVSPSSGKDSYNLWFDKLDAIPRIYIAYDNDKGGTETGNQLAERLGAERCWKINYQDCKDANEFLKKHTKEEFRALLKGAKPFLSQQFQTVGDVIQKLKSGGKPVIETKFIPNVKFERGWMAVISGRSNVGKTSYVLNVASELAEKGLGVLILPFERGIESVGERFLQVRYKRSKQDFLVFDEADWGKLIQDAADLPLYFAMPNKEEVADMIVKAKKHLNVQVVIIDHLDYLVRQINSNRGDTIMDTLQQLKRVAEEHGVLLLIVSHIRKIEKAGEFITKSRRPNIEDLKGSSSLYQDPEVVVMLSETEVENNIYVDVLKNKGEMGGREFYLERSTGEYIDGLMDNTDI